ETPAADHAIEVDRGAVELPARLEAVARRLYRVAVEEMDPPVGRPAVCEVESIEAPEDTPVVQRLPPAPKLPGPVDLIHVDVCVREPVRRVGKTPDRGLPRASEIVDVADDDSARDVHGIPVVTHSDVHVGEQRVQRHDLRLELVELIHVAAVVLRKTGRYVPRGLRVR